MSDSKKTKLSPKEIRQLVIKALKLNEKADKGYTLRYILNNLLYLVSEFLAIILVKQIINGIADGKGLNEMLKITALNVGLCMLANIMIKVVKRRQECHEASNSQNLNNMINEKVMHMDFSHIESPDTNNRIERTINNMFGRHSICSIPDAMAELVYNIFTVIIGVIMILPSVLTKSGQSGIIGFICSPFGFLSAAALVTVSEVIKIFVFNARFDRAYEEIKQNKEENLNNMLYQVYLGQALRSYRSCKEIRIYGQQELFIGEMERSTQRTIKLSYDTYKKCYKYNLGLQLMNLISRIIMYGYSIFRAMYGTLSPGDVIAFVMLFTRISSGITNFSDNISMCRIAATYIKDVFDFLEMPDEQYKGTIPTEKRNDNEYEFEFRHVWFKYPNTEQYVLRNVNMKWRIGEKMALVGRNGCGKSTLVKLLCRLYDPTKGEITLNSIDIRKYNYDDYMALFSVVFQDSSLFAFSLAENVAASTEYDAEKVEDCVRRSGLSERLDTLPEGISTYLYKEFDEHGVEISGGEAQKLCLARAIYKGAPFIVLDEPTAALDPISEHDIYTKFNGIVGTRTAIYISHRLSSCRFCDEITVMDNGEIVERGSHDMLVMAGGHYAQLWSAQAEYYRDTAGELFE